jgi:electron transfer flavoprotein beta subunit
MNIVVPIKLVPDLVDELEIADDGCSLDTTFMRLQLNELDDHALEEAVLIKEAHEAQVTVMGASADDLEDALYNAAARGADNLIQLNLDSDDGLDNHSLAKAMTPVIEELSPDLILTGVQAHNDLDGQLGGLIAAQLGWPYVGYIAGVEIKNGTCQVRKEYPGGLVATLEVKLPAVLGIQAAESPPRYIPISRIRQAKDNAVIVEKDDLPQPEAVTVQVTKLSPPETGEGATLIEGDPDEMAQGLLEALQQMGVL